MYLDRIRQIKPSQAALCLVDTPGRYAQAVVDLMRTLSDGGVRRGIYISTGMPASAAARRLREAGIPTERILFIDTRNESRPEGLACLGFHSVPSPSNLTDLSILLSKAVSPPHPASPVSSALPGTLPASGSAPSSTSIAPATTGAGAPAVSSSGASPSLSPPVGDGAGGIQYLFVDSLATFSLYNSPPVFGRFCSYLVNLIQGSGLVGILAVSGKNHPELLDLLTAMVDDVVEIYASVLDG